MMRGFKYLAAGTAAVLSLSLSRPVQAADAPPTPAQGYVMPSTQSWELTADSGDVYRIFVSYPAVPPPPNGFPVLYVLDGNAMFAGFADARRIQEAYNDVGKSIVVGIGYPGDQAYNLRRLYDLTGGPSPQPWRDKYPTAKTGGWNPFLDFLTGKLRREIASRFKIDPERQALFGHSLGGLFAIHALYEKPAAFHAIIAASPSLFWHDQEMLKAERDFATRLQSGRITTVARLMVVAADREETPLERWDTEAFVKRMAPLSAYGLRTRSEIYAGEGHMTVPIRAVSETLRFAFTYP